jgi:two-component system, cell cycle sensor histidine kinase and response regulator CckA
MLNPVTSVRSFFHGLGPVEQAQIVASTAVVVTMVTILSAMAATGQTPRLMDFISILAVGLIGLASVYFSLLNSRRLDEQRRQLIAINTVADAVNRIVPLDEVLRTAITNMTSVLNTHWGWVYLLEGERLVLHSATDPSLDFLAVAAEPGDQLSRWLGQPHVERERLRESEGHIIPALKDHGIQSWTSIPLRTKETLAGVLIVAGTSSELLAPKQAELVEAIGNTVSIAIHNARLFDRLRQSEGRYADLFENAPDLYISVDRQHTIVGCNRSGARLLGISAQQIIGKPFECLFDPSRTAAVAWLIDRMFAEGKELKDAEEHVITPHGSHLDVLLNSSLVFDEAGTGRTARIVARDITERKKMEAAILHAQKIDSIGNLAGGIAHDFNNILAAILGSASIMRRHLTDRVRIAKYVEIIESSARRGSSLTRQLLTFARKTHTITAPIDIHALILETLDLFQRSVTKDITVRTSLSPEPITVNGDDGQIQQALLNLFLNARDAMPEKGVITVSTTAVPETAPPTGTPDNHGGPFVEIRVSDTGRGIPREIQDRIFEPFFTTKDNGTGLGLSVVYGVLQNHGGYITLDSSEGMGTTFSLFLPRHSAATHTTERKRPQRLPRGTENVLVIDDEPPVCEIAQDLLTSLGYTVYVAHNGREGVEFYRSHRATVDLILLDINMPVMSGTEAFEYLRTINPHAKVIIVTGYGKGAADTPRFTTEVNGFVQKPFQIETLAIKVRKVLDQHSFQEEAGTQ